MATVKLTNVKKIYGKDTVAVQDFNLEIADKEFIVFVGPSGCGKSTTLRMIAGLEDISAGTVEIDGVVVNDLQPRDRNIAMVFQNYALYPHLTVFENMAFPLRLQKMPQDEVYARVTNAAEILGITEYLTRKPRALSGGQRQRVAVGRAIIRKVGVFLMDEPLSNLDAKQRVTMRAEIAQIHRQTGATTIYVTHDQIEAMTLADRIVIMKEGYIQQVGTPYELYFKPVNLFVAGFIGEPPMNFIRATVQGGCIDIAGQKLDITANLGNKKAQYEGKEIVFGFRPEAITLGQQAGSYVLNAKVELTEMLGDNTNVYINIGPNNAILKVTPYETPEMDTDITFSIPLESAYLFDAETEFVITQEEVAVK